MTSTKKLRVTLAPAAVSAEGSLIVSTLTTTISCTRTPRSVEDSLQITHSRKLLSPEPTIIVVLV